MANERNAEARIKYLTEELHKANMEINRLVLENQEQDFEIHRLKKQRDEMFGRLMHGLDAYLEECDDSTDDDDESTLIGGVSPSRYTAEKAQEIASAMQETLKKFNLGYAAGFHDKQAEA